MLLATELATCSLVMTPTTSSPRGTPRPLTTIAMNAFLRHIRCDDVEGDRVLAHDGEVAAGDVAQGDAACARLRGRATGRC